MYIIMYKYSTFNRNRKYFLSFQYVKELPAVIPGLTRDLIMTRLPVKPAMTKGMAGQVGDDGEMNFKVF